MTTAHSKISSRLIVVLLLLAGKANAQFEGIVESQNVTTDEGGGLLKFKITMWIKNDRIRVETGTVGSTPPTTMIYRGDRKITWMLNEEERSFFEILQSESSVGGDTTVKLAPSGENLKKTGKHKKILGYACDQYLVRDGTQVTEIWVTRSLANLLSTTTKVLGDNGDGDAEDWNTELRHQGMFTLSAKTIVDGKMVEAQDMSKIERRAVDEEKFELPEGYKKQIIGGN